MSNTVTRFSNRVANYVKYRPGYPPEMLDLFRREMGLTKDSVLADIGSGTGLSTKPFLENGNTVYGVEPNEAMRDAAEEFLKAFPNFISHNGTAENTNLDAASMDFVIAAQAFHWFDVNKTRQESLRILKPGGWGLLMWNTRQLDATPFLRDYERLLLDSGTDYLNVRHDRINQPELRAFFGGRYDSAEFDNAQPLDFTGLRARLMSSSYVPKEDDSRAIPMLERLREIFDIHQQSGRVNMLYRTQIYYGRLA